MPNENYGDITKKGGTPKAKGQTSGKVRRDRSGMNVAGKVENTKDLPR